MEIKEITMTPALAAKLLQGNIKNRPLNQRRVSALAATLASGGYIPDGNPIKLTKDKLVLDGQHRLAAVVRAGVSVPVVLITGLEPTAQLVMDSGRSRSFNDYLHIRNVADRTHVAGTTRLLWNYDNGVLKSPDSWSYRPYATNAQLWEFYQDHQEEIDAGMTDSRLTRRQVRLSPSAAAVAWIIFSRLDPDDTEDFFGQIRLQKPLTDPAAQLLVRLLNNRDASNAYDQQVQLAVTIKAWNAYRRGQAPQQLAWRRGGKQKEKFPEPE